MTRMIICSEMIKRSSHKRLLLGKKKELCKRKELDEFLRSIEFNSGDEAFVGEEGDFVGEYEGSMKISSWSSRVCELRSAVCGGDGGLSGGMRYVNTVETVGASLCDLSWYLYYTEEALHSDGKW
ncbi:hypothetical protein GQ457_15G001580 [Hibiscus cannabinus]